MKLSDIEQPAPRSLPTHKADEIAGCNPSLRITAVAPNIACPDSFVGNCQILAPASTGPAPTQLAADAPQGSKTSVGRSSVFQRFARHAGFRDQSRPSNVAVAALHNALGVGSRPIPESNQQIQRLLQRVPEVRQPEFTGDIKTLFSAPNLHDREAFLQLVLKLPSSHTAELTARVSAFTIRAARIAVLETFACIQPEQLVEFASQTACLLAEVHQDENGFNRPEFLEVWSQFGAERRQRILDHAGPVFVGLTVGNLCALLAILCDFVPSVLCELSTHCSVLYKKHLRAYPRKQILFALLAVPRLEREKFVRQCAPLLSTHDDWTVAEHVEAVAKTPAAARPDYVRRLAESVRLTPPARRVMLGEEDPHELPGAREAVFVELVRKFPEKNLSMDLMQPIEESLRRFLPDCDSLDLDRLNTLQLGSSPHNLKFSIVQNLAKAIGRIIAEHPQINTDILLNIVRKTLDQTARQSRGRDVQRTLFTLMSGVAVFEATVRAIIVPLACGRDQAAETVMRHERLATQRDFFTSLRVRFPVQASVGPILDAAEEFIRNDASFSFFEAAALAQRLHCNQKTVRENSLMTLAGEKRSGEKHASVRESPEEAEVFALVWHAVAGYKPGDRSDAQIATDRATMRLAIIVVLARCIRDDGYRICGVGMRGLLKDAIALNVSRETLLKTSGQQAP
jgi:hypothetical protein